MNLEHGLQHTSGCCWEKSIALSRDSIENAGDGEVSNDVLYLPIVPLSDPQCTYYMCQFIISSVILVLEFEGLGGIGIDIAIAAGLWPWLSWDPGRITSPILPQNALFVKISALGGVSNPLVYRWDRLHSSCCTRSPSLGLMEFKFHAYL